jgi:single-strand DNA-binding protein
MASFNKVILIGNLVDDPELKQTPNGVPVVSFSIAVNRRFQSKETAQQQTDFFNVTAWRATAEFVSRYFRKGSSICVVGTIQNRTWTDTNGQKRYATDIIADEVRFVDSQNESQSAGAASPGNYVPEAYTAPQTPAFEDVSADDSLPF